MYSPSNPVTHPAVYVLMLAVVLASCAGKSTFDGVEILEQDNPADQISTGYLRSPAATQGMSYKTATQSGNTDESGRFRYIDGEEITFSIGATSLPAVLADTRITPEDLGNGDSTIAINITRLLLSLDEDAQPDNGIMIPKTAAQASVPVQFDLPTEDFAAQSAVSILIADAGGKSSELASEWQAKDTLQKINTVNLTVPVQIEAINASSTTGRSFKNEIPLWTENTPGVRQTENTLGKLENNRVSDADESRWYCFVDGRISLSFTLQGKDIFLTEHRDNSTYTGSVNLDGTNGLSLYVPNRRQPVASSEYWRFIRFTLPGQIFSANHFSDVSDTQSLSPKGRIAYQQSPARFQTYSDQRGEMTCELYWARINYDRCLLNC